MEKKHVPVVIFVLPAAFCGSSDPALAATSSSCSLVIAIEFVLPKRANPVQRILDAKLPAIVATFNLL
jgi:hypothetical protein